MHLSLTRFGLGSRRIALCSRRIALCSRRIALCSRRIALCVGLLVTLVPNREISICIIQLVRRASSAMSQGMCLILICQLLVHQGAHEVLGDRRGLVRVRGVEDGAVGDDSVVHDRHWLEHVAPELLPHAVVLVAGDIEL